VLGGVEQREHDVRHGVGAAEQLEALKNKPDLFVPHLRELGRVHLVRRLARQFVLALGRTIKAAQDVHQGGFTRPRRAHDGDKLIPLDVEIDPAQRVDLLRADAVGLLELADLDGEHVQLLRRKET